MLSLIREEKDAPDELSNFFCKENVPLFLPPQLFFQSDRPSTLLFTDAYTGKVWLYNAVF